MKHRALLLSVTLLLSFNASASSATYTACSEDKSTAACKAYIAGMVQGYIASMQNAGASQPSFKGEYANRAFASRVSFGKASQGYSRSNCLPDNINPQDVVNHMQQQANSRDLTQELTNYLNDYFSCNEQPK